MGTQPTAYRLQQRISRKGSSVRLGRSSQGQRRYMKKRISLSAAFTLLALLMMLTLQACNNGAPPIPTAAPTRDTASAQQLQGTIEALQTKVVAPDTSAPTA